MKLSSVLKISFLIAGLGIGLIIASFEFHSRLCFQISLILFIISWGVSKIKTLF
jgi:hypothetical protein